MKKVGCGVRYKKFVPTKMLANKSLKATAYRDDF